MAARLNTKFILLAIVTVVAAGGIVAGLAFLRMGTDAAKNIAEGDALMDQGEYARALSAYGRAAAKEPSNLEYLGKVEGALTRIVPETVVESQERFRLYRSILDRRTGITPRDGDAYVPYVALLYSIARIGDAPALWQDLQNLGDRMVSQIDETEPRHLDGRLYRGVGAVGRIRILDQRERDAAIEDLRAVIAARPNDDLAWTTLIQALNLIAEQDRSGGRPSAVVEASRKRADEALAEAIAAAPNGVRVARAELLHLLALRDARDERVTLDRVDEVSSRLAINAADLDDALLLSDVVDTLARVGDPRSFRRAVAVAEEFRDRNPDSLFGKFVAMKAATFGDDPAATEAAARAILDAPLPPVGLEAAFRPRARSLAAERLFDNAFIALERAAPDQRETAVAEARAALERLRVERGTELADPENDPMVLKAEGRIAFASGKWSEALGKFERVIRQDGQTIRDPESLYLSSQAALRSGDFGLAKTRITQALQLAPGQPIFLSMKAQVELAVGNVEQANKDIDEAARNAPDSEFVRHVRDLVRAGDDDAVTAMNEAQRRILAGDIDGARTILADQAALTPSDIRVARQRARLEAIAGERARAVELARAGLELAPDDADLRQLLLIAETEDRLAAIVGAAEIAVSDERLRPMSIHMALQREAALMRLRADERERQGNDAGAASDRADAERLTAALSGYREQASKLEPPDPRYLMLLFDEAITAGDLDQARTILERERQRANAIFTPPQLVRLEARILVSAAEEAGKTDPAKRRETIAQAVQLANDAAGRNPESTELHLLVGELQGFLGNLEQSVAAYERAYAQRPTDTRVVDLYATALQRAGERTRLLTVLREAARLGSVTPALLDAWLDAEAIYGSPRVALTRRRSRWVEAPADSVNALKLINLLVTLVPTRELAVDARGNERFTESAWRGMAQPQQREALEAIRRQWIDEATRVIDAIEATPRNRFQVAGVRAELARRKGDIAGGEQLLRSAIAAAGDDVDAGMWLSLGNYLLNIGNLGEADAAFAEAVKVQGPMREADRALTDTRVSQGRVGEAITHLRAVVEASPDRIAHLRLVELLQRADRIDEAELELESFVKLHGTDAQTLMVRSLLVGRRAADATGTEASELRDLQRSLLRQASDLSSADPTPLAAQAESIVDEWVRKESPDVNDPMLNEALQLLDSALSLRADHWPSVRLKTIIVARRGDLARARAELDRLLALTPVNDDARAMLIELWEASRNTDRAIQVAQEAIDRSPMNGRWLAMLGDLKNKAGDRGGAIAAHRRSLEVDSSRTPDRLIMLLMEPDRAGRRDLGAVIQFVEASPSVLDVSPYIRAAYGAALAASGQRDRGLEQLRLAHAAYRKAVAERPEIARAIGGWYDQLEAVFPPQTRMAEYEAFARSVTEVDASWPDLQAIGVRLARTGPGGLAKGTALLTRAEELSRNVPPKLRATVLFDLGVAYIAADRCEDAVRMFREGVKLDPDNAASINNLAYLTVTCLGTPKDLEDGLNYIERAIRLSPNVAEFHDTHGTVLARLGRNAQAETAYRTSLSIAPTADTHIKLAALLVTLDRKSEARDELRRAVALNPRAAEDREYVRVQGLVGG